MNPNHMPTMHKEFSAWKKSLSAEVQKQNSGMLNLLNRFQYRYRMTKAFETIVAVDVEKRTVDGYACGMKLFMAYSAYDEIRTAEKILENIEHSLTHAHRDEVLARKIRENEKMKELLLETLTLEGEGLRKVLRGLYQGRNNEIMCFATCVRHCFVHGDFTTARSGLTNKKRIAVVNEVTDVVLKVGDGIFSAIIQAQR